MKKFIIFLTLTLILISVYFNFDDEPTKFVNDIVEEGDINVYFCPGENCFYSYLKEIKNSQRVYCAFYDINHNELISLLKSKGNVKLYVDEYEDVRNLDFVKKDDKSALSHNKFCVLDDKIITGSLNPTYNGVNRNNNNYLIIKSEYLVENYLNEFNELWNDKENINVNYPVIFLDNLKIENYFCPEDFCEDKVYSILKNAEESVYFMTFSFTSDRLGELLLNSNLEVKGVFEKSQAGSPYSEYHKLIEKYDVRKDSNGGMMHHKVFIIDKKIVITGSYNPTKNGNENNDENVLIIHSKVIAKKYLEEFEKIYN